MKTAYEYISGALDELFLLSYQRCSLTSKQGNTLDKAEVLLTELLDSFENEGNSHE